MSLAAWSMVFWLPIPPTHRYLHQMRDFERRWPGNPLIVFDYRCSPGAPTGSMALAPDARWRATNIRYCGIDTRRLGGAGAPNLGCRTMTHFSNCVRTSRERPTCRASTVAIAIG